MDRRLSKVLVVVPSHNGQEGLGRLLPALCQQALSSDRSCLTCVVNDGSDDETSRLLAKFSSSRVISLQNPIPTGRARACNQGAAAAQSDVVVFVDVDCLPKDSGWLRWHLEALTSGADLSVGPVLPRGEGFWSRYMGLVATRRHHAALAGNFLALTSANLALRRESWNALGGFDACYTRYGFEDRDLLARAIGRGMRIAYTPAAAVETDPPRSAKELARKSETAGRCSAPLFRATHPALYRQMPFWWFDAQVGPVAIRWFGRLLAQLARPAVAMAESVAEVESVPLGIRLAVVRIALGLAFMRGTLSSAG